jgi:16S rRNA (cytidine1402-2'-O)-methyltransferase
MIETEHPTFFYESVHRIEKLIKELRELWFQGHISIAREVSKLFEQFRTGNLEELAELLRDGKMTIKGEFVIGIKKLI